MKEVNKSSRRNFLEKMVVGSFGVSLSAGIASKVLAGENAGFVSFKKNTAAGGFVSDKKFVPVMITPYKQNGQIDFDGSER